MEIRIDKKELLNALGVGGSLAGRNKVLPILDNVKVRAKGNALQVVSMDSQSAIQKKVELLSCDTDGEFAVNASDLLKAVKTLKETEVVLVYSNEENNLVIKHSKGNITLTATTTETFPSIQTIKDGVAFSLPCETLFAWLNIAKAFVANDNVRPVMDGLFLEAKDESVTVCASDGMKLFTDSTASINCDTVSTIIPSNVFGAIQSVINGADACTVKIDTTHTLISVGDASICVRNIEGRYPKFRAVIPTSHLIEVEVNKDDFMDSLSRAAICNGINKIVRMVILGGNLELCSEDIDFGKSAKEVMQCSLNGDGITIGFKHDAILSALTNIESDNVVMRMTDNTKAIVLLDTDNTNRIMLTMPCLLS